MGRPTLIPIRRQSSVNNSPRFIRKLWRAPHMEFTVSHSGHWKLSVQYHLWLSQWPLKLSLPLEGKMDLVLRMDRVSGLLIEL